MKNQMKSKLDAYFENDLDLDGRCIFCLLSANGSEKNEKDEFSCQFFHLRRLMNCLDA